MTASARVLGPKERDVGAAQEFSARDLARKLPSLTVMARQVAATVSHGVHGRKRAGVGETFWQFRPYVAGESTARIDWRRSARDGRVYVREREQEAAHTVWIWIDRSPSMAFVSSMASQSKVDRALVLGFAAADLLVRGGERVGLLGLTRPMATRDIVDRLAESLIERGGATAEADELPRAEPLAPRMRALLFGDFLSAPDAIAETVRALASRGAQGHLVMISDPIEDAFPFVGHTELRDVDSGARMRLGRAESLRVEYLNRLDAHREAVRAACAPWGWSCLAHRTDRPAAEALLALRMRLETADVGTSGTSGTGRA